MLLLCLIFSLVTTEHNTNMELLTALCMLIWFFLPSPELWQGERGMYVALWVGPNWYCTQLN